MAPNTQLPYVAIVLLLYGGFSRALKSGPLKDLHIMGLFPMQGSWSGGEAILPAVLLGIEHVNNREDILPGYKINMTWADTKCIPGYGVHVMHKMFNEAPPKMLVLGAGCSRVCQPTAESSHYWNVVQLSYTAVSPALSDKQRYPKFFRTSTSDIAQNPVRIAMCKYFGWKRVATISESSEIFTKVAENMAKNLPLHNITLITAEIFTADPSSQVASLKKHDARIIFLGAYEDKGLRVFCEAYKQGLYGSHIVWFTPGWYNYGWWLRTDPLAMASGCTTEQIIEVSHGMFNNPFVYLNPEPVPTAFGMTSLEYQAMYDNFTDHKELFAWNFAPHGFDAAMALSLALNMTMTQLIEMEGSSKRMEEFRYDDLELNKMIYDNFWKVEFQGVKGAIYFDENGDCPAIMKIERIENGVRTNKAFYAPEKDEINWLTDNPIQWEGGEPPADSTLVIPVAVLVPVSVYLPMCALAVLGILMCLVFFIFNTRFRKRRIIKMSSPFINNIILFGCVIVYSTVIVKELDTESTVVMCQVRTFTLMIGFSMAFGALFAKTWRVHVIFTSKRRMLMKDSKLVAIVAVIVGFDIILFTVFTLIDPMAIDIVDTDKTYLDRGNTVLQSQVYLCTSEMRTYFDGIVFASKGLMLIFGVFLAWETRKVNIPALNDSQFIGMCIYNVVILSIMGVVLAYVLTQHVILHYVLISAVLVLGTTMTQAIIFLPKIVKLKEQGFQVTDEGGGGDDTKSTATTTTKTSAGNTEDTEVDSHTEQLEKEISELKSQIKKKDEQIKEKDEQIKQLQAKV